MVIKNNNFIKYLDTGLNSSYEQPYIIAEVGVNHGGDFNKALKLIDLASEAGANAVKFQTFKAGHLASRNSPSYWDLNKEPITSQYKLFKKYDKFNKGDYLKLANYCNEKCVDFLSTPFDHSAVEFLDPLLSYYKIASADINNLPLLRKIAEYGKPIIISTGASTINEINHAIKLFEKYDISKLVIMHCILSYPTLDTDANLGMINDLKQKYPTQIIGYSDHTVPNKELDILMAA